MKTVIETERLILREFDLSDAQDFYEPNLDEEVMRYTADRVFASVEESADLIRNYDQYAKYGYGRWTVVLKETDEVLGWCGLKYIDSVQETDLGYRLKCKFWNKGYGTEAAAACLQYGFEQLGLNRVVGRTMKDNATSIRLLEKIGMRFLKEYDFEEHPGVYYRILKEDFKN
ncbi:MAG: GNAT family N-acetyltransferase [Chitinophagaceae bacterium]|nr:GNAT family N-acetyltransferase [Chitinophagaceae bacterium]MCB9045007.1 GNAT family N-acetyltransferase [Chitinophagales bacterium]